MVYVKVNSDGNDMTQKNLKQTYSIKTKIEHRLFSKKNHFQMSLEIVKNVIS